MFRRKIGDNIELRLIEPSDAFPLYALVDRNRDRLRPWLAWVDKTNCADDLAAYIARVRVAHQTHGDVVSSIWYDGALCGCLGLEGVNPDHSYAEIGYWLASECEGKGIITQCAETVLDYAFGEMKLNRVQIRVSPRNARSRAVVLRLGCTYEGTLRQVVKIYDKFEDLDYYSILRDEWNARKLCRDVQ